MEYGIEPIRIIPAYLHIKLEEYSFFLMPQSTYYSLYLEKHKFIS